MTRPSLSQADETIPDEVMEVAGRAMRSVGWYAPSKIRGAAYAILAERERCARMAEIRGHKRIAAAIRSPHGSDAT